MTVTVCNQVGPIISTIYYYSSLSSVSFIHLLGGIPPPLGNENSTSAGDAGKIDSTLINRLNLYILLDTGFQGQSGHTPLLGNSPEGGTERVKNRWVRIFTVRRYA